MTALDAQQRLSRNAGPQRFLTIDCHVACNASNFSKYLTKVKKLGERKFLWWAWGCIWNGLWAREVAELMIRPGRKNFCGTWSSSIRWLKALNTVGPREMNKTNSCGTFLLPNFVAFCNCAQHWSLGQSSMRGILYGCRFCGIEQVLASYSNVVVRPKLSPLRFVIA